MIRICRDIVEISRYKKYSKLKNGSDNIAVLILDKACFRKAREMFAKGNVLIEVRAENGETVFYLKMHRDRDGFGGADCEVDINFEGCNLLEEKNVDTSLLERNRYFLFNELEEYTYELAEFMRNRYPDARIYYLDEYAKYFWDGNDNVVTLNSIYEINSLFDNRFMFVYSDTNRDSVVPEGVSPVYNSRNVMNSLCWARKIEHFGTLNADKTILLIDMEFGKGCGLAYIVRTVATLSYMAYERGWIPVASLRRDNMYIDSYHDNMWEQYFEPVSNITVHEAMKSQNVISAKNNHLKASMIFINPYFNEIWNNPCKHPKVIFKSETMKYFANMMPVGICDKDARIMGAFIRGTDAKMAAVSEKEAIMMALECKEIMEDFGFDKIFLATEDTVFLDAFKAVFKNTLLYVDQKRVTGRGSGKAMIGELLDIEVGERKNFGLKYLMITYCLSQCNALVYNMQSGGYYLANMWSENAFEFSCCIEGKQTELRFIIKCMEMVRENDLTAVYGTGLIGKRLLDIIKTEKNMGGYSILR